MHELRGLKIVVTGGAGFIGSNLVHRLADSNYVTVIDNVHSGSRKNIKSLIKSNKIKFIKMNSGNIAKVEEKPDLIFHLGMYSSSPMYKEDNSKVSQVLDEAIKLFSYAYKNNVQVVFASSSSLYNGNRPPHKEGMEISVTDFYTEARYAVERLAELYHKLYGLNAIGLRFFSVYGPREEAKKTFANLASQFLWAIEKNEQPVIYGDGKQTRDLTYVEDVVDALIMATKLKGFDIFNVGTGAAYSMNELVRKLNEKMGKKITPKYVQVDMKNYVMETLADTKKASNVLGFKAQYNLDRGLDKLLAYYGLA